MPMSSPNVLFTAVLFVGIAAVSSQGRGEGGTDVSAFLQLGAAASTERFPTAAEALAIRAAGAARAAAANGPPSSEPVVCNIFTYYNYPKGRSPSIELNIESWRRHTHGLCKEPVLVNDTNVLTYIPDMPSEFFRMPYDSAKSDLVRYALLYHHGGMYFDTDFLVAKDMDEIVEKIGDHDLVTYEAEGQDCNHVGSFSSNFMAGKKGSVLHRNIWAAQKSLLSRHCPESEEKWEKTCCFEDKTKQCHVPWTQIGEGVSHSVLQTMRQRGVAKLKFKCYWGDQSFVPWGMVGVLHNYPMVKDAVAFWQKEQLEGKFGVMQPLNRMMYHLFSSINPLNEYSRERLLDNTTLIGALYRRSGAI